MQLRIPAFEKAHVLVVGDVMLDRYWHGPTSRISPEAPVPVVHVNHVEDRPGGAGNVALNIAALGAGARLIAVTGKDDAAKSLTSSLNAAGVACDFIGTEDSPTIIKLRVMSRHQQLIRLDFEEGFASLDADELLEHFTVALPHASVVVLSDYNKGCLQDHQALINAAKVQGISVLADPKGSDFSKYKGATLLTPNLTEFEAVVGACETEEVLVSRGLALLEELELQALLITRGENGMTLLRAGQSEMHFPARAREVFDVTGAGDTVISVLAASLAAGESLPISTALSNIAASIVVKKLGTAAISAPELRRAVSKDMGSERGVMTREQLKVVLEDSRQHGEKIVMTNGCFDILHAGHVTYLEQAKAQGDRLILAINDDDSVKRLKGEGRPINPVDRRMAVLAGLSAVDWVVPFGEDTPHNLLNMFKPDVLVKGGDYTIDEVVGAEVVESYGGEVKVLSLVDSCSTTAIVEKIREDS
ncbi:MAG: bifunctional heptose 7-phosphate kinase/heptose 1-phosphate adenyltransferase [Moraxellaceae bacterium]|nr:MAG: bifunctional heptose 7-phosphate kinase/heptose 1-phosphate adenyltransferase [Moraxellaceae bacterium]